jgi:hypothetical protein
VSGAGPAGGPNPDTIDGIASAVLAVPGVTRLHPGLFGEVATHLPGRRVAGIRLTDDRAEVHVAIRVDWSDLQGGSVLDIAERARRAATAVAGVPVDVIVEDLALDDDPAPVEEQL